MKKSPVAALGIIGILLISCIIMYFVEASVRSGYLVKSVWKIGAFLILPLLYCVFDRNIILGDFFRLNSGKQALLSLGLGAIVYVLIFVGYLLLKSFIDLENIAGLLTENLKINKENFLFVALYIAFINSLLEEFFFRGFAFLSLKKMLPRPLAYMISALAFALYHVAILANWFSPWLFILTIAGLFISGLFFNLLNEKNGNIYNSWLVHMFANFGINTVGLLMFGIFKSIH